MGPYVVQHHNSDIACICIPESARRYPIRSASWTWSRKTSTHQLKWWFLYGNHKGSMALETSQTSCNRQAMVLFRLVHCWVIPAEGAADGANEAWWPMVFTTIGASLSLLQWICTASWRVLVRVPLVCDLLKQHWPGHSMMSVRSRQGVLLHCMGWWRMSCQV